MYTKKFLIVSDTRLSQINQSYYAFEPVSREINFLQQHLDFKIFWIGFDYSKSNMNYPMHKINADISVKIFPSISTKLILLRYLLNFFYSFYIFVYIFIKVRNFDIIHSRCPSLPGFVAILVSFCYRSKNWWHKYAGNWSEVNPPLSYFIQKELLIRATNTRVTINGFWDTQPKHCISFENPCLTDYQLEYGRKVAESKKFKKPYRFVFVGRLEDAKGVQRIINAFRFIELKDVESIDFIGDGPKKSIYKNTSLFLGDKVHFHGFLNSIHVHKLLEKAHYLLLPSTASEGFPKVIAEAACYGVIPIVSDVGSISHYMNFKNSIVLSHMDIENELTLALKLLFSNYDFSQFEMDSLLEVANKFSFNNFLFNLKTKILVD